MNTTIRQAMNLQDWLILIFLSILWGGSFVFIAVIVRELPALTIVFIRLALAALMLWAVILVLKIPKPDSAKVWSALLVMGLLNNALPFTLIVWGQVYIEAGLASIFNAMTPIFTLLVAGVFLADERISGIKIIGVVLGLSGAVVMVGADALQGMSRDIVAQLAVMGAALSYGFAIVWGRRFKRFGMNPITIAAGQVTMSSLLMAPLALLIDKPFSLPMPSTSVWVSLVLLAVFCTSLAYILYFRVLASAGATNASLVTFLVPVSAILLGFFFLGERLELKHFAGMFLIAAGLSAIDGRLWKKLSA